MEISDTKVCYLADFPTKAIFSEKPGLQSISIEKPDSGYLVLIWQLG